MQNTEVLGAVQTPELRKYVEQRVQRTLKLEAEYKSAPNPWLKKLITAR